MSRKRCPNCCYEFPRYDRRGKPRSNPEPPTGHHKSVAKYYKKNKEIIGLKIKYKRLIKQNRLEEAEQIQKQIEEKILLNKNFNETVEDKTN